MAETPGTVIPKTAAAIAKMSTNN